MELLEIALVMLLQPNGPGQGTDFRESNHLTFE